MGLLTDIEAGRLARTAGFRAQARLRLALDNARDVLDGEDVTRAAMSEAVEGITAAMMEWEATVEP